ncbi:TetR/AcrR family transcriptional regulator [Tistrella mobilis]
MSSASNEPSPTPAAPPRRRLSREERLRQLLDISWTVIRDEGTDALTLGRLAERAGVTKPVVYDHFGTRQGLLTALYRDFDARQTATMTAALEAGAPTAADRARIIAACYVDCVAAQGREIPGVLAALAGSPELAALKRDYQRAFLETCRQLLGPFAPGGDLPAAGLWAMLGAADALSDAAVAGDLTTAEAQAELRRILLDLIARGAVGAGG